MLRSIIRKLLPAPAVEKIKARLGVPDMFRSIGQLKANGFQPDFIIDVGAYHGEWSLAMRNIYPQSSLLMIEAQPSKKPVLEEVVRNANGKISYALCLLGEENKPGVPFYVHETVSSVLSETEKRDQPFVELPMRKLDDVVMEQNSGFPAMIKLDVQGYELEVLKGAAQCLQHAEVVLMEVSLIEINKGAPLLDEVVAFMKAHHFFAYDICSMVRRPLDKALWQVDIIFVHRDSPLRASKHYE